MNLFIKFKKVNKKYIFIISCILISSLIFIFLLELYLRNRNIFPLQSYQRNRGIWKHFDKEDYEMRFRETTDIELGWEYIPNQYGANSLGFIDKERKIEKKSNVYRICIIGDSITEDGRYVNFLEQKLNNNKILNYEFEVWNCGVGAYNVTQYYANIRNKVINFKPDMLIICFCVNDFTEGPIIYRNFKDEIVIYGPNYISDTTDLNIRLFTKFRVYRFFKLLKWRLFTEIPDNLEIGRWALNGILEISNRENIKLVSIIVPYFKSAYEPNEGKDYLEIKQVLNEYKIPFLDLHNKFKDIDNLSWRNNPNDVIHPSEKGHKLIAEKLHEYLTHNRLIQ